MTDRRGTHDKHGTFPDVVTVGARSDIATIMVTGCHCTGANSSIFVLSEDPNLLCCIEAHCEEANRPFASFAK